MPSLYPLGTPPGFPHCPKCPYVKHGSAKQCIACATATLTAVGTTSCGVCSQTLDWNSVCMNWLCRQDDRRVGTISAIAVHDGALRRSILRLKYDGMKGWAVIFGRLLYGWVSQNIADTNTLIVANPTHVPAGTNQVQHTELVLDSADAEDVYSRYKWDVTPPRILEKIAPTPHSAATGFMGKREAAEALSGVLKLTAPSAIAGRPVLVYDDVCTTGLQLNAVAGYLLDHGATSVDAVVLARAPWQA